MLCTVKNLPKGNYKRGGVLPSVMHEGTRLFCLGIDATYQTLCDFAGTREPGEDIIDTCLREAREESLGLFGNWTNIDDLSVIHNDEMVLIVVPIKACPIAVYEEFHRRLEFEILPEMTDCIWLTEEDLRKCKKMMYPKLWNFLMKYWKTNV